NSSASKGLMNIFDMLDEAAEEGRTVTVNWRSHPENEMAIEYGEEFEEDLENITFNMVELEE
ncbi:MAG: SiaC family regulatory phosphoprotein, partial [Pseudomonadota bacterium]